MKRRIVMAIAVAAGIFALENVVDILVSRYLHLATEVFTWAIVAVICGLVVYEIGEDRGDW